VAMSPPAIEQTNQDDVAAWGELRPVLHAEVERLPDRYRIPVILSYLEGKTNEEVAALLRWPVGTVKGRLSRARDLLRSRLIRRGLGLSAAFLMTSLSHGTVFAEVVPAELVRRTVRLAARFGPRSAAALPAGPQPEGDPGLSVTMSDESMMTIKRASLRFTRRNVGLLMLAILTFSIATGIWIAMFKSRAFSPVPGAFNSRAFSSVPNTFSAISPARVDAPARSCH
jgi:Sigma-70, region 4